MPKQDTEDSVPHLPRLKCTCSHCRQPIEFPGEEVGQLAPCPKCRKTVTLKPEHLASLDITEGRKEAGKTSENLEQLRRSNYNTFVYVMEDLRNGLFKIGQSQTPEKREHTLQSEVPQVSLRFYVPAHDSAEKELHDMFAAKRIRGEWFQLTQQDILSIIEFLKQHGDLYRASADYDWLGKITLGVYAPMAPSQKVQHEPNPK